MLPVAGGGKPLFPLFFPRLAPGGRAAVALAGDRFAQTKNSARECVCGLVHALLAWFDSTACTPILAPRSSLADVYAWMPKFSRK